MKKEPGTWIEVVGLGQACVDYLGLIPEYPEEDGKTELAETHMLCGGPASTAMVTLQALGIKTSFLGSISDDHFGKMILQNLVKKGVDVSQLKITPGYSSQFAFIAISRGGKRTIFWHRGTTPPLKAEDVNLKYFPEARVLHMDGLMAEACIEAARQAKAFGLTVVMDAGTWREGSKELCELVDILIASATFAAPLVGKDAPVEEALKALKSFGPQVVVITQGAKGSVGLGPEGLVRQEAFQVEEVDTTGAGDVYHGAYIYQLLRGGSMAECMRFASAAAALNCTRIGAQAGIPALEEVELLLETHSP